MLAENIPLSKTLTSFKIQHYTQRTKIGVEYTNDLSYIVGLFVC
jgi:hypothetical protein